MSSGDKGSFIGNKLTEKDLEDKSPNIVMIQAYTEDPSNPAGYENQVAKLSGEFKEYAEQYLPEGSVNFGGILINPAQLTVKYVDENGKELKPSVYKVSDKYPDYLASSNPTADISPDSYYFAGNEKNLTAPEMEGYITPEPQDITLKPGLNIVEFVYKKPKPEKPEADDKTDENNDNNSDDNVTKLDNQADKKDKEQPKDTPKLAETGEGRMLLTTVSSLLLAGGLAVLYRRK